jgi:Flp pilus assembly protein CpaB
MSRLRIGIIIAIIGIALIALGAFALFGDRGLGSTAREEPTPPPVIKSQVVVTTRDMALGTLLTAADVTIKEVPIEVIPRNSINLIDDALDRFTKTDMVQGEMVLQHNLSDPTNVSGDIAFYLQDDHVLMAFPANDLMSRMNVIKRGDIVDILVSIDRTVEIVQLDEGEEPEEITSLFTFDAFQRIEITALVVEVVSEEHGNYPLTYSSAPTEDEEEEEAPPPPTAYKAQAYLLALPAQDALILKNLRDNGAIFDFVVRSPLSTRTFTLDPVMDQYINEKYGLQILP